MSSQPTQGGNRGGRNGGVGPRTRSQQQAADSPAAPMRAPDSLPPSEPVAAPAGGWIEVSTRASSPFPSDYPPLSPALGRQSQPTRQALRPRESPQQPAAGCIYSAEPPQPPARQPAAPAPASPAPQQERPRNVVQGEEVDEQRTQEDERVKAEETLLRAIIRQRKKEFEREQVQRANALRAKREEEQLAVLEAKKKAERYIEENRRRRAAGGESNSSTDAFRRRPKITTSSDSSRSRSPISRRPPSPITRSPPGPMTRRPPSPLYRRPPSPITRRSPSPMTHRPPSPMTRRRSPSPMTRRSLSSQRNEIRARHQEVQLKIEQSNLEALLLAWEKQELENELTRIEIARLRSLIERESADPEQGTNADGSGPSTSAGHRGSAPDRRRRSDDD